MVSPREMELLTRQLNQAHRAAVQAELAAAGLGEIGHPMLLAILHGSCQEDADGFCHAQRELAELLHISPAAVANSLKSLEKGGYVQRRPGPGDARRNQVLLTETGRQAVAACQNALESVSRRMLDGFTPAEQEQLLAFRQRMLRNLLGDEPKSPAKKEEP